MKVDVFRREHGKRRRWEEGRLRQTEDKRFDYGGSKANWISQKTRYYVSSKGEKRLVKSYIAMYDYGENLSMLQISEEGRHDISEQR